MPNYWRDRELENMAKNKKTDAELVKAITSRSEQSMKEIEKQINAFYGKYATDEGITMAEAKKRVSKLDIEEYAKKAKRYVKGAHSGNEFIAAQSFTNQANSEMAIYNLTMKVNRLELLKLEMSLELAAMSSDTERFLHEKFTGAAREEYLRQSGILGMTVNGNAKNISAIVGASFHNATWSERLWANQQALRYELDTLLTRGIIQGKNPRVLARELRKSFDASIADSERLMITEMARIQEAVFTDSMMQAEIDEYEYIAEAGACRRCAPLNRKVFKVSEGIPGSNKAPMHPRCRCSSAAHVDRAAWESKMNKSASEGKKIKLTDKIKSDIPEKDYQKLESIINRAPQEVKDLWEKVQSDLVMADSNSSKSYYKHGQGVHFNIKEDSAWESRTNRDGSRVLGRSNYSTFFHEFGHNIDALYGRDDTVKRKSKVGRKTMTYDQKIYRYTSYDMELSKSLKGELKDTLERFGVKDIRSLTVLLEEKHMKNYPNGHAAVSDIISGLSGGFSDLGYGHSSTYWKKKDADMLGKEAFANMFQAYTMQGDDHEFMKLMFPKSYGNVIDFIKERSK